MLLQQTNFGGMVPILSDRLIGDNFSADAANVDLLSGEARPLRAPVVRHTFETGTVRRAVRLVLNNGTVVWLPLSSIDSDVIKAPLVNDAYERYYILDPPGSPMRFNTGTRLAAGDPSYLLGLPIPVLTPTVTPTGGSGTPVTRSYVYTFVDQYGQEGPPSLPGTASGAPDGTWTITTMDTTVPSAAQRPTISKRIYRTETGSGGTASYFFVAEITLATTTYADTIPATEVTQNDPLDSLSGYAPLNNLRGVVLMAGGFLVGFEGRNIHCSAPYKPWQWPPEYDFAVEHRIVGLGTFDQSLVVATAGVPYVATGTTPDVLTPQRTDAFEPCIAKRAVVGAPDGVLFASANGLILVGPAGVNNVTRNLVGREKWSGTYAEGITGAAIYETAYVATVGGGDGFTIDSRDPRVAFARLQKLTGVETVWNDPFSASVYMLRPGVGGIGADVLEWQPLVGPVAPCLVKSKEFKVPQPHNFGWAVVHIDLGAGQPAIIRPPIPRGAYLETDFGGGVVALPVDAQHDARRRSSLVGYFLPGEVMPNEGVVMGTSPPGAEGDPAFAGWPGWAGIGSTSGLNIEGEIVLPEGVPAWFNYYADRRLVLSIPIYDSAPFRLPSGFKTDVYQWVVVAAVPVFAVQVATTRKELRMI